MAMPVAPAAKGRPVFVAPVAEPAPKIAPATQAGRDRESRRILERELERAEQQLQRLLDRLAQGFDNSQPGDRAAASETLSAAMRARSDVDALKRELSGLTTALTR